MKMKKLVSLFLMCLLGIGAAVAQDQKGKTSEASKDGKKTEESKKDKKGQDKAEPFIQEITVTATRVETELMKTPIAVSAFDQIALEQQGVKTVRDLGAMVPNMDIATINGQSTPIISMRGVRSTNETELGDPSVGIHLDGIYSPRMQGILGLMFDNERVEVLRGPQGTLFGRNSTVGSINIISAKPDFSGRDYKIAASPGNYNAREFNGMVNLPVNDKFAVRFAGRFFKRDSYIDGYWDPNQYDQRYISHLVEGAAEIDPSQGFSRTQHSNWWLGWVDGGNPVRELVKADPSNFYMNADEYAYRLSARWFPQENLTVDFSYQQFVNDSAGGVDLVNTEKLRGRPVRDETGAITGVADGSGLFPEDNPYQAVVNIPGKLFLDIQYLRTKVDWNINDTMTFIYSGGFENQARESAQDMEQSLNAWDGAMFFLDGTGSESWMHEVQLQSYGSGRFNWIAGANMFHETTTTLGFYHNSINDVSLWDQPDRSSDSWSLFTQGTFSVNDRLHLTVGLRHSDETKEDVGGRSWAGNNDNGVAAGWWARNALNSLPADYFENKALYTEFSANDNKGSWDNDDFRLGLDYDVNDSTLLYTYLATGFKAGGIGDVFHEINPRTNEEIDVATAYDPEQVTTWEFGFKKKLLNGRLNLAANYFISEYEDMQYASVGAIAFTDRWQVLLDSDEQIILDDEGNPTFGWVTAPIVAYYTQNVPDAKIQGFEIEYNWVPWEGGRIHGYASGLDTEITEDWITKWNYDAVSYFGITYEESIDPTNELLEVNLKGNELAVSPPLKLHVNFEQAFPTSMGTFQPWVTMHWEDDSYLTIWNVEKHVDTMDFVIPDEDIKHTDDKREAFSTFNAGIRFFYENWSLELYGYNITDEIVQYWGGAAEGVAKGSFSSPAMYGLRFNYDF